MAEFDSRCSGAAKGLQPLGRKERFLRTLASRTKQGSASASPSDPGLKLRRALSKVSFIFFPLYSHSWLISTLSGASNPIYMPMVPTPSGRPHFTNCLLPRISEGYYNLTFPKLNSPQTCLPANSSCFNSSLTVPPKPEIWGSSYTSSDNTLNHLKFFPRSEFLQLWVRCA